MELPTQVTVWAPWIGGALIGIYLLVQLVLTGKPLGVSTGYGNLCGLASRQPYFHRGKYEKLNNWRLWFTIGLPLGGIIALMASPGAEWTATLSMGAVYDAVVPESLWLRIPYLLGAGMLIGIGARMAGGCTSGHSISGIAMLNPPSILASALFFVGGIVAVQLLFRVLA